MFLIDKTFHGRKNVIHLVLVLLTYMETIDVSSLGHFRLHGNLKKALRRNCFGVVKFKHLLKAELLYIWHHKTSNYISELY